MNTRKGLDKKLREFFILNQGAELTYQQIADRFHVSIHHARTTVSRMQESGLVESRHVIRGTQEPMKEAA